MKLSLRSRLIPHLTFFPWLLAAIGGLHYNVGVLSSVFIFSVYPFFVIYVNYELKRIYRFGGGLFDFQSRARFGFLYVAVYWVCFFSFSYMLLSVYEIAASYDFNLAYARTHYFRSDGGLTVFPNVYVRMVYNYIIVTSFFVLLFLNPMWKVKEWVLILLYLISSVLVGGRFGLYIIFIVFLLIQLSMRDVSLRKIAAISILFCIAVFSIGAARVLATGNDFSEVFGLLFVLVESVYKYHTIQLGVLSELDFQGEIYGLFTGLLTPVYVLFGLTSPEGNLAAQLDEVSFHINEVGHGYNAFGTSLAYFYPYLGPLSVPAFFLSVFLSIYAQLRLRIKYINPICVLNYNLLWVYFSAFQPRFFGFSWLVGILLIACLGVFKNRLVIREFFERKRIVQL